MIKKDELTLRVGDPTLSLCDATTSGAQFRNFERLRGGARKDMRNYDIPSPNAAEMYFNHSIFGQLYTLIAETLGKTQQRSHKAGGRATVQHSPPAEKREAPRQTLLDRLDAWFWRRVQKDREAYLAGSRDVFELERRIEALERGAIARYY
jgi:hypothetical protein